MEYKKIFGLLPLTDWLVYPEDLEPLRQVCWIGRESRPSRYEREEEDLLLLGQGLQDLPQPDHSAVEGVKVSVNINYSLLKERMKEIRKTKENIQDGRRKCGRNVIVAVIEVGKGRQWRHLWLGHNRLINSRQMSPKLRN